MSQDSDIKCPLCESTNLTAGLVQRGGVQSKICECGHEFCPGDKGEEQSDEPSYGEEYFLDMLERIKAKGIDLTGVSNKLESFDCGNQMDAMELKLDAIEDKIDTLLNKSGCRYGPAQ